MKHICCSFELLSPKDEKALAFMDTQDNTGNLEEIKNTVRQIAKDQLTKRQREILLRVVTGQKQKQIARELQIDKSTVSRTYHRGLRRLEKYSRYLEPFLR